ncbi:hypothetical protein [Actinoalloteichus caeruleus]|uniref:hypothetical protein n=1 Tax=Actinoalloteichus cyanogriseus TaxID=2893586 RepID=UPI003AAEC631
MTVSVADVVAQARAVLVEIEEAQRGLVAALDRAERGCQLTAHLLLGSADHDVVWVVKSAADAAEPVKQAYEAFGRSAEIIRRYLDGIAGDVHAGPAASSAPTTVVPPAAPSAPTTVVPPAAPPAPTTVVPPAAPSAPMVAAPPAAPPRVGTWRGKTASDYARDKGEGIGRRSPHGRRIAVREVDTADEVREIFDALSQGAREVDVPGYRGVMMVQPDGTRIGYRYTSASTKDDPTLDIRDSQRNLFKVHVAMREIEVSGHRP